MRLHHSPEINRQTHESRDKPQPGLYERTRTWWREQTENFRIRSEAARQKLNREALENPRIKEKFKAYNRVTDALPEGLLKKLHEQAAQTMLRREASRHHVNKSRDNIWHFAEPVLTLLSKRDSPVRNLVERTNLNRSLVHVMDHVRAYNWRVQGKVSEMIISSKPGQAGAKLIDRGISTIDGVFGNFFTKRVAQLKPRPVMV